MKGKFTSKFKTVLSATIASLALGASLVVDAAPVYKVTKGDDTVYIGGTIHLLTEKDYPLQAEFEEAYKTSDEIYFETDIGVINDPAFAMKAMPYLAYTDGSNLKAGLKPETFSKLDTYMQSKGLPIQQFLPLNPTGVMLTLTVMEYQAQGFTAEGVDEHFHTRSVADSKTIGWFEEPEEQLAIIGAMGGDDPDLLIEYTLEELAKGNEVIGELHDSWRLGDMERLSAVGLGSFEGFEEMYDVMIKNRNDKWMTEIEPMFGDEGTELILVGALHLPGPDGVLTQLEALGYKVEQLSE